MYCLALCLQASVLGLSMRRPLGRLIDICRQGTSGDTLAAELTTKSRRHKTFPSRQRKNPRLSGGGFWLRGA
ncbi:hypothetical protein BVI1335_3380002 [Burkholderia vietnamiensis]|nr:hypothetical protein BVI1335_3380002 [Burkholderia vietnamiensis]